MLKFLKNSTLQTARTLGIFELVARSRWRQQNLVILCYHGLSLKDEHEWDPLFIAPAFFRKRLEHLERCRYRVLPLNDAVGMLREGSLPARSVVITFDDGFHDFHQFGFPMLREFGFPATVYQTTYYSDYPFPIFNLILRYLFWRGSRRQLDGAAYGVSGVFDLASVTGRERALQEFLEFARVRDYTPVQKNELAARIAAELGVDYAEIMRLRMLQLMTASQIAEIAAGGIDVQLHTHRHRTPVDENLFVREIRDNRQWLTTELGRPLNHFCYPSGQYRAEFLPWLRAQNIVSATTCDHGMATRECDPLLLPRLLDSMNLTDNDFEGWLCGVGSLLPRRSLA